MREISQRIFGIFRANYIDKNANIFELPASLTLIDLAGEYAELVRKAADTGEISANDLADALAQARAAVLRFILYQIGSTTVELGVPCGYYDERGKDDGHGIAAAVNRYLFDCCFDPKTYPDAHITFVSYLLMSLERQHFIDGEPLLVTVEGLTRVLDSRRLARYWSMHSAAIKGLNLQRTGGAAATGSYMAPFRLHVPQLFEVLDKMISDGLDHDDGSHTR